MFPFFLVKAFFYFHYMFILFFPYYIFYLKIFLFDLIF